MTTPLPVGCGAREKVVSAGRVTMKLILSAHVLLLDRDERARQELVAALRALGIQKISEFAARSEADAVLARERVDVVVVAAGSESDPVPGQARRLPAVPGDSRISTVLLLAEPSRADMRLANSIGYDAVMALPVSPRILYRRIGSVMQRARRQGRGRLSKALAGGPVMLAEAAEAKE